ncbi:MAG: M23 family metallopeptidase [Spirochaetales bacterium]|nr:M23 family metallopeptidase [Spirochaetales bacterium]
MPPLRFLPMPLLRLLGLLLWGALAALPVTGEVLFLHEGASGLGPPRYCQTAPGAQYSWSPGEVPRFLPERGLFSWFSEGEVPLRIEAELPEEVDRGGVFRVLVVALEPLEGLSARLIRDGGEPGPEARGFSVEPGGWAWTVLLGVESTARAGDARLVVQGWSGGRTFEVHSSLRIRHREFGSESIDFDQPLSELMTVPDPRKEEEYRQMRELLGGRDPQAVHHLGSFIVPVQSTRRTSEFADRRLYRYTDGGSSRSLHNGVDLAAPIGTPVVAAGAGRVVMAADRLLSGLTVVLEHLPGVYSLYYHLDTLTVTEGEPVAQGQRLGTVGMTGLATGPHLHWEVRVAGIAVDPDSLVATALVDGGRLLKVTERLYMGLRELESEAPVEGP